MAYIFDKDELPRLISQVPGRERVFFADKDLTGSDDVLAGVMYYTADARSAYHYHANCEHFYLIFEGTGEVETPDGTRAVKAGDLVFFPAGHKHRLSATSPMFYFEIQAPNRFKTTILDGTDADLLWNRVDGKVWAQS